MFCDGKGFFVMDIRTFMKALRASKAYLTRQQITTLKGQALSGDIEGAYKGIATIIKRRRSIKVEC